MAVCGAQTGVPRSCSTPCPDKFGCPSGVCPDFTIKRHDTMPPFRVSVSDCNGPLDLQDSSYVVEVNMWAKGKLKVDLAATDEYFALADNIGFEQVMQGDIIIMDRVRRPEQMLVNGFDEENKYIHVQRGYADTDAVAWKRGTGLKIFRIMNGTGNIVSVLEDQTQEDGTVLKDQLVETFLEYSWQSLDTCLPGCYWLEFKLLKIRLLDMQDFTPISYTPDDFGCGLGAGVEWVRRFPEQTGGFLIKIVNSFTPE